jgi:hypothetical protein
MRRISCRLSSCTPLSSAIASFALHACLKHAS